MMVLLNDAYNQARRQKFFTWGAPGLPRGARPCLRAPKKNFGAPGHSAVCEHRSLRGGIGVTTGGTGGGRLPPQMKGLPPPQS